MIEVLKQMTEALEDITRLLQGITGGTFSKLDAAIQEGRQAIAELESQEPVEWGVDWGKDGNSVSIIKRLANGNIEVLAWEYAPHPPQRTWVGLTKEEVAEFTRASWGLGVTASEFIRAVEARVKEKNNA
jgi:hypothetical protein